MLAKRNRKPADMARYLGLHSSAVSRLLSGERNMRFDEATRVAEWLEVPVDELARQTGVAGIEPLKGFGEEAQAKMTDDRDAREKDRNSRRRHPAWGLLKGTTIVMPGVDLTAPTAPQWGDLNE